MENLGEIPLPPSVTADGWIPFVTVILLTFIFSYAYVKYLWCQRERDKCSAVTTTIGMTIALLAALLLPVDVFLVSYMKNPDGSFKDWATNTTREAVENSVTYTYYGIYSIMFVYSFFILPLVYFYYEERDDDYPISVFPRALLYTVVFVLVIITLLVAGLLIPFKSAPTNSTQWDKIEFLVDELAKNRGKDALSFVVHVLTVYGMLNLILYTGVGMASFPITLMKGFRSLKDEEQILSENQISTQSRIRVLRDKQSRRSLSSKEAACLASLEEEESLISRRSQLLQTEKASFFHKIEPITRFINAIFGVLGIVFSIVLWVSLLICNIDKLLHSLGYKMGYALEKNLLPNPLDFIMVEAQKIFPLDYILFFGITIYLVICTISGMRHIGICCLCVPMYKIRPRRTVPQALIMISFLLMFSVLAFHILMFAVMPTYATFGSQSYCVMANSTCQLHQCSLDAPSDDCIMTRSAGVLLSFAYKAWIFSTAYFWLTWGVLASFVLSLIMNLVWSKKSSLEEAIDKDDFDESGDEQMIRA